MALTAGKLRHRVELQSPIDSQDSSGEFVKGWMSRGKAWAAIEPVSVREFVQSAAMQSEVTTRITLRARTDITAAWRVVHVPKGGPTKIYNVQGVLPDKDSGLEYISLPCSDGVNQG